MRGGAWASHSGVMTTTGQATAATEPRQPPRLRAGAVLLVVLTMVLAFLVVTVSYGLTREYGDATATDVVAAGRAVRDGALGILLVTGLAALAVLAARRSRGCRALTLTAVAAVVATLLGVPAGAVIGVHQKFESFPAVPSCTDGFTGGPAVPVVEAAQDAFEELEHPGPFSGGGESGIDGCASELMVGADVDVPQAYRRALPAAGWRVTREEPDLVRATKDGLRFEARRDPAPGWRVRIGPADRLR